MVFLSYPELRETMTPNFVFTKLLLRITKKGLIHLSQELADSWIQLQPVLLAQLKVHKAKARSGRQESIMSMGVSEKKQE